MLDYKPTLVTALQTATNLPVLYELVSDSTAPKPCITYQESNNYDEAVGDTLGYSRLQYTIKLWGTQMSILQAKALLLASAMRQLGFTRTAYNELIVDSDICLIFTYTGLGQETITT